MCHNHGDQSVAVAVELMLRMTLWLAPSGSREGIMGS
jgi:hypothetical protein